MLLSTLCGLKGDRPLAAYADLVFRLVSAVYLAGL
jgi:hypothetical protein